MGRWDLRQAGNNGVTPNLAKTSAARVPAPTLQTELAATSVRYVLGGAERMYAAAADGYEEGATALPSAPSGPLKEYEDKLKAVELCARGMDKAAVATVLGRSEHWVKRWWRRSPETIPRPDVRHSPLVKNAPLMSFRDLELKRRFAATALAGQDKIVESDETIFEALVRVAGWQPARRATRDPDTGALKVRFDVAGRSMVQPKRHVAEYRNGLLPQMDAILKHMFAAANINDTRARIFMNYYEDGVAVCPSHRHDFWTCMLSFGAERVAIIEDTPFLLRDGDLLIFGTQSHSLPAMPDLSSGRVSVVVFYRPEASCIERRWATLEDQDMTTCNPRGATAPDDGMVADRCCQGEDDAENQDVGEMAMSRAAGVLVDTELLGCPGISLGFYSRISFSTTTPVAVFTVGCENLSEGELFTRLSHFSISDIWDLRSSTTRCAVHWSVASLRRTCSIRLLRYVPVPLGGKEAGGIDHHIVSEEGRDVLARVVQAAMSGRAIALMGEKEELQSCKVRQVVADQLVSGKLGPISVIHIGAGGASTNHPSMPFETAMSNDQKAEEVYTEEPNLESNSHAGKSHPRRAGRWRSSTCEVQQS